MTGLIDAVVETLTHHSLVTAHRLEEGADELDVALPRQG